MHGKLVGISQDRKTLQVQIGKDTEVIYFDDSTALKNAGAMQEIPIGESVKIILLEKGGRIFAREVEVKKGVNVPAGQPASLAEVPEAVSLGPDQGESLPAR